MLLLRAWMLLLRLDENCSLEISVDLDIITLQQALRRGAGVLLHTFHMLVMEMHVSTYAEECICLLTLSQGIRCCSEH